MKLFSVQFWLSAMLSTCVTIVCIYLIKKANEKVNLPIVSDMIDAV